MATLPGTLPLDLADKKANSHAQWLRDFLDWATEVNNEIGLTARFAPVAQDTPDMTIKVQAGDFLKDRTQIISKTAQNTGTITAPTVNPRIDRVVLDRISGVLAVITGVENASPVAPAFNGDQVPIAQISLLVSQTSIVIGDITDERQLSALGVRQLADSDGFRFYMSTS